jgi:hypothetical protein
MKLTEEAQDTLELLWIATEEEGETGLALDQV